MEKAFKFRIYPNKKQQILLVKTFGCVRYVWNYFLTKKEDLYHRTKELEHMLERKLRDEERTYLGYYEFSRELTILKQETDWLKEPDKWALQNAVKHLDQAYKRFFKLQRTGPKYTDKKKQWSERTGKKLTNMDLNGHPQFKRKHDNNKSYTTTYVNNNIEVLDGYIKLPKLGKVKYRDKRRNVEGRILNATVSQEPSGKYYVSVCCTDIIPTHETNLTWQSIGIDLGIKEFAITSDGYKFENPKFLKAQLKKLKRLQRAALSRKTIGGSRWKRNKYQIAVLYERIRHSRLDFHHQLSTKLVKEYDLICLETLKIKNMIKNHNLAQAIHDAAWGQFVTLLKYKAEWNYKQIIQVSTKYPSSQLCSKCGYKNPEVKDLSVREWICPNCGTHHDRDVNAAKNLLIEGLRKRKS